MKKLLLGSVALTLFSISIVIFQISCKKEVTAQTGGTNYTLPSATTSSLGGIIVGNGLNVTSNGTLSVTTSSSTQQNKILFIKEFTSGPGEIWTANYNGTNAQKINITVPAGMTISVESGLSISPDRQTIFFMMYNTTVNLNHIYSCNLNGSNLMKIVDGTGTAEISIGSAY